MQHFLITETQMVIQTEVALQADHVLSACDGGKIPHCRNCYLINLPAYPSSTIVNIKLSCRKHAGLE